MFFKDNNLSLYMHFKWMNYFEMCAFMRCEEAFLFLRYEESATVKICKKQDFFALCNKNKWVQRELSLCIYKLFTADLQCYS